MTDQEMFSTVYLHLKTQGKLSKDEFKQCFYRSADGLKCAVGCLIPDDRYTPGMESRAVDDLFDYGELEQLVDSQQLYIAVKLQGIHDSSDTIETCLSRMRECAEIFNWMVPE